MSRFPKKDNPKIGDRFTLDIYAEVCCDLCNEIIHNHFDCPVCKEDYVGTETYGALYYEDPPIEISCQGCGSRFRFIGETPYLDDDFKLIEIGRNVSLA